jgi:hypothetical protein
MPKPTSVVVIPTYRRPEMLALTLEKISSTTQAASQNLDVRIFLDHTILEPRILETEYVRDNFFPTAEIFHANNHPLVPSGSWNILQSLKAGYDTKAEFVFFIEEDVLVTPDFFDRHLEMQASGDYFVTCGRKLKFRDETYFSNPGSCYKHEKLGLVVPHICPEYFANQKAYLETRFPDMSDAGILDDGTIRRVMQSVGGKALCAEPRIASHIGFHMYGRSPEYRVEGSIEERIAGLRRLLPTVSPDDRYTGDFEPFLP